MAAIKTIMKALKKFLLAILALELLTGMLTAQSYSIDWHKVSGGGGTSGGGSYSLSGTIGQADASAPLTGGNYSLVGGFWSLGSGSPILAAPILTITGSGTSVTISWPVAAAGYVLQTNGTLASINWGGFAGLVSSNGTNWNTVVSPAKGSSYFRLFKP
jgi:hypothetical protein